MVGLSFVKKAHDLITGLLSHASISDLLKTDYNMLEETIRNFSINMVRQTAICSHLSKATAIIDEMRGGYTFLCTYASIIDVEYNSTFGAILLPNYELRPLLSHDHDENEIAGGQSKFGEWRYDTQLCHTFFIDGAGTKVETYLPISNKNVVQRMSIRDLCMMASATFEVRDVFLHLTYGPWVSECFL